MPVLAAVLKMLLASTFFSSGFFTSSKRLKRLKAAKFMKVQAQNSRPEVGDVVIILDTDFTQRRFRTQIEGAFVIKEDDKSGNPYRIDGVRDWLHETDVRLFARNSRPAVGDMVIVLDTDFTQRQFLTQIGKQFVIIKDDGSENPYQISGVGRWLHEADVRLIARQEMLVAMTSPVSPASSQSLTSKMKWGDPEHAQFADAKISAADGRSFAVHRAVLAAASPFFEKAFSGSMREASNMQIDIPDASGPIEAMLAFIYSGQLDDSHALAVLPLAHRYEVTGLVDLCIASIVKVVNATNIVSTVHALRPLIEVDNLASAEVALKRVRASAVNDLRLLDELLLHL